MQIITYYHSLASCRDFADVKSCVLNCTVLSIALGRNSRNLVAVNTTPGSHTIEGPQVEQSRYSTWSLWRNRHFQVLIDTCYIVSSPPQSILVQFSLILTAVQLDCIRIASERHCDFRTPPFPCPLPPWSWRMNRGQEESSPRRTGVWVASYTAHDL